MADEPVVSSNPTVYVCEICTDSAPFEKHVVVWETDGARHQAHAWCFHRARADEQAKLLKSTQEVFACVLSSCGGTVNVSPAAIQRAISAGFRCTQEERRGGGFRMRLGDNIPEEPKPAPALADVPDLPPETANVPAPVQTP